MFDSYIHMYLLSDQNSGISVLIGPEDFFGGGGGEGFSITALAIISSNISIMNSV